MHINPFRKGGNYYKIFAYWQERQYVTRKELHGMGFKPYDVTIILSPREEGKCKGIPQGNIAAHGERYYAEKRGKVFRLRWRREELEPLKRMNGYVMAHKKLVESEEYEKVN
jgi:hypothetical protein